MENSSNNIDLYINERIEELKKEGVTVSEETINRFKIIYSEIDKLYEEKIKSIDENIQKFKSVHIARQKAKEEYGIDYMNTRSLVKVPSKATGREEPISSCHVTNSAIHLHCDISIDVVKDENGNPKLNSRGETINYFQYLIKTVRDTYYSNSGLPIKEQNGLNYREHIEPLIYQTMKECVKALQKYPHLKQINIDTNEKFFYFIWPAIKEYGFVDLTNTEEFKESLKLLARQNNRGCSRRQKIWSNNFKGTNY